MGLMAATVLLITDQEMNIVKLGFTTKTPFESTYKVKPDYITQTVFAAERKDVRTYREL